MGTSQNPSSQYESFTEEAADGEEGSREAAGATASEQADQGEPSPGKLNVEGREVLAQGYAGDAVLDGAVGEAAVEAPVFEPPSRTGVKEQFPDVSCEELRDGSVFLDELQLADAGRALWLVQNASTEVVNAVDGMENIRALLSVAAEGHLAACQALLDREDFEGVNACDVIGSNALHLAAGNDAVEVCRILLACPRFLAGVNAQNFHMRTPLDFARDFGEGECEEILKGDGGIAAGGGRKDARKSGRWNVDRGTLELEPVSELDAEFPPDAAENRLPTLEELVEEPDEPVADMSELD